MDFIKFANQVLQEIANKKEPFQNNLINMNFKEVSEGHRASGILYGLVFAESAIKDIANKWKAGEAEAAKVYAPAEVIEASSEFSTPDKTVVAQRSLKGVVTSDIALPEESK